jgi:hypothetical protein
MSKDVLMVDLGIVTFVNFLYLFYLFLNELLLALYFMFNLIHQVHLVLYGLINESDAVKYLALAELINLKI